MSLFFKSFIITWVYIFIICCLLGLYIMTTANPSGAALLGLTITYSLIYSATLKIIEITHFGKRG